MIRVVLVEDHCLVRAGLRRLIDDECEDIAVIGEASDGRAGLEQIRATRPDVAVIDLAMPGFDGFELLDLVREAAPEVPVLVLTMHEEGQYAVRAIEKGAKGYLTKRSAPEQFLAAIRRIHDGGRYLTEAAAEALAVNLAGDQGRSELDELSSRELQVLRRLALGQTNREIAETLNISVKTVDTYRLRLLKKLNLRNNADLSRFAIKHGLVEV
ncbi:MAG: response regulator [Deferrisomatales bacterium]